MKSILYNSDQNIRLIWRFLSFIAVFMLVNIAIQETMRLFVEKGGLLRGNLSMFISFLSLLLSLFIQIEYLEKSSFKKYGLQLNKTWIKEFAIGCAIAASQLTLFFLIMYYSGNVEITGMFLSSSEAFSFIEGFLTELYRQLLGSTIEEIISRAFLFYIVFEMLRFTKKDAKTRVVLSCALNSLLFGFAHIANPNASLISSLNLTLDAASICLPFLITARLGMSIGMHFSWNIVQSVFYGFANSGNAAKASILHIKMPETLFTGGSFGPEGSVLLLPLSAFAILFVLWWKKRKNFTSLINQDIIDYEAAK